MLERTAKSNIHFLIDVKSLINYKKMIIRDLKARGVTHISLFANTDEKNLVDMNFKPIINYFNHNGIMVDNVLTMADLHYRDVLDDQDFEPGDAYRKFISHVEEEEANIKDLEDKLPAFLKYHSNKELLVVINLLSEEFIDWKTKLSEVLNQEEKLSLQMEAHILRAYKRSRGGEPTDLDFKKATRGFFKAASKFQERWSGCTLDGMRYTCEERDKKLRAALPKLSPPDQARIKNYIAVVKKYFNSLLYATFLSETRAKPLISPDYTQRDLYVWFAAHHQLHFYDLVIFVSPDEDNLALLGTVHEPHATEVVISLEADDSDTANDSTEADDSVEADASAEAKDEKKQAIFKNEFQTVSPRKDSYKIRLDAILKYHMMVCLKYYVKDSFNSSCLLNNEILQGYIINLYEQAHLKLKQDQLDDASQLFMMAYLLCDDQTEMGMKDINRAVIVRKIVELKKHSKQSDSEQTSFVDTSKYCNQLYNFSEIMLKGGFEMKMRIASLNLALHKAYHPQLYRANVYRLSRSISSWLTPNPKTDFALQNEICIPVFGLAKKYLDKREQCIEFLSKLSAELLPPNDAQVLKKIESIRNLPTLSSRVTLVSN